ncbi:MAG TPA: Fic family protein [Deltaproteobacteria bacterium]|nr:Fic family protein [Deltaproteobacteria bacterium]
MNRTIGQYRLISTVGGETCNAFIPDPLPPDPPLVIDDSLQEAMEHALLALGRLDSISTLLPDIDLFLYMYVRKEAVLSSQIEGTQSSLSDLLAHENAYSLGIPVDDVTEVSNYVAAMNHGLSRIREGFPLSNRLIKEIHEVLLQSGRGNSKNPGEFRRSQNWIGGSRPGNAVYVPPPPDEVAICMSNLEKFLHDQPSRFPVLLKVALAHVQFETIHPFLDGNGRIGRLLITLLLCTEGVLSQPLLYLSLYFKTQRQEYYDLLQSVRTNGEWEAWIAFFLAGVTKTATQAVSTAQDLIAMFERDRKRIADLGKISGSALRVHHVLQQKPIVSVTSIAKVSGLSIPTINTVLKNLAGIGLIREITGQKRSRIFSYSEYIKILNEGT